MNGPQHVNNIEEVDVLGLLVQYNLQENLPSWLRNAVIEDDKLVPKYGMRPGRESKDNLQGFLMVRDGLTLVPRLKQDKIIIHDWSKGDPASEPVRNREDVYNFMVKAGKEEDDAAYMIDTNERRVITIEEFYNGISLTNGFKGRVTEDFLRSYGKPVKMGLRTKNAIRISTYPGAESFLLRQTPGHNAGLGIAGEFHNGYLTRTHGVQLARAMDSDGPMDGVYSLLSLYQRNGLMDDAVIPGLASMVEICKIRQIGKELYILDSNGREIHPTEMQPSAINLEGILGDKGQLEFKQAA